MWSAAVPPIDGPMQRRTRRAASKDAFKASLSITPVARDDLAYGNSPSSDPYATPDIDYMEPAIDGPPSPERLRQLSKQMKRASHLNRSRGHSNEMSAMSPRRAMDRAPWDAAADSLTLQRHPSNRSNSSSTPSRERESVQVLGRNLFQRTANKAKRASSSHSSSNSSLYSGEMPGESAPKDSFLPTLFARRKPSRDDTAQRRLQISGPFNFQHITHTQRENLSDLQRGNRLTLGSELSTMRPPGPATAPGVLKIEAHDLYEFPTAKTDALMGTPGDTPMTAPPIRPSLLPRHTAPALRSRQGMRPVRSQEALRTSPPRSPPQSQSPYGTVSPDLNNSPPIPPPRYSSRQSLMPDGSSAFGSASPDRPRTSGGFRQPQPFDPSGSLESPGRPPATSHGFMPPSDFEAFGVDEKRCSHALTTPDDAAWPLVSPGAASPPFDKALPDVPEEEDELPFQGHSYGRSRSRLSITSNNSSLRGSHSVPALRLLSQSQRTMSGTSDTLGQLDVVASQRALRAANEDSQPDDTLSMDDNWEDIIDYCYEHEADANFDYQWEQVEDSSQLGSPPIGTGAGVIDGCLPQTMTGATPPTPLRPVNFDATQTSILSLSPTSQKSSGQSPEMPPPSSHLTVTNNFSLPRVEKANRVSQLKGVRPMSYASSFRESHGFNLSPSLLIPGDFHQQMLAEKYDYADEDIMQTPYHDEVSSAADSRSPMSYEQRSSTSTTETNSTSHTDTTGERHVSANSAFTAMTRLTLSSSSTSLNKAAEVITESAEPLPTTQFIDPRAEEDLDEQGSTPPATQDKVPELTPFPVSNFGRKSFHRPHASESQVRDEIAIPPKSEARDLAKLRRPRARTSSLSAQIAPPVGQYALFPRSNVKGTGDRI